MRSVHAIWESARVEKFAKLGIDVWSCFAGLAHKWGLKLAAPKELHWLWFIRHPRHPIKLSFWFFVDDEHLCHRRNTHDHIIGHGPC